MATINGKEYNTVVIRGFKEAERFWRFVQQSWDIPPGKEEAAGDWVIFVPEHVDPGYLFWKFLYEELKYPVIGGTFLHVPWNRLTDRQKDILKACLATSTWDHHEANDGSPEDQKGFDERAELCSLLDIDWTEVTIE